MILTLALATAVPAASAQPHEQSYPKRNGGAPIRVIGCNVFDPDGILIEMSQLQK